MRSALSSGLIPAVLSLLIPAAAARAQEEPPARGCATGAMIQRLLAPLPPGAGAAAAARVQAAAASGRVLLTDHFAIHYTVAPTVHRVRLGPQDNPLMAIADSVLSSLPSGLSPYKRDSTLHAALDTLNAAHPAYAVRAAEHFERAREYYDSLGMRMPGFSSSRIFLSPSQGRFAVDIADMGTADVTLRWQAYYGLAYPPAGGGQSSAILLENDFLYYNSANQLVPVTANIEGQTRNYNVEWDMGIKVTASHEFYHGVQYEYTPNLISFHAWYELSATGMEERLAPEVNDYFQYLPSVFSQHAQAGLLTKGGNTNYGNAIFHVFLTRVLGAGFDVAIWEHLADTNNLPKALVKSVGQARWDSLYAAYAASLALAGRPAASDTSSPLVFSPDMPRWPRARFDTVPAAGAVQLALPALTFRLARPPVAGSGLANLINFSGAWRLDSSGAGYQSAFFPGTGHPLTKGAAGTATTLALANPSFTMAGQALLSKSGTGLSAARNPVRRTESVLFFLPPEGGSSEALIVVSESGRRVATLAADTSGTFWSWNLKDPQNRIVPPGVYFFGTAGLTPKSLLVLP